MLPLRSEEVNSTYFPETGQAGDYGAEADASSTYTHFPFHTGRPLFLSYVSSISRVMPQKATKARSKTVLCILFSACSDFASIIRCGMRIAAFGGFSGIVASTWADERNIRLILVCAFSG